MPLSPIVPTRSIMPNGWNGVNATVSPVQGANQGGATQNLQFGSAGSSGGSFVWSDSTLTIGLVDTGIHTRILKDVAVVAISVVLLIVGLLILTKPDLDAVVRTAAKVLPEVAA